MHDASKYMTHNSTTNQKSRFSVLASGAHNVSKEGKERRAHKSGSSLAHNRSTLAAHLPPSNHRPTRNRRVPSHSRPAISAANRRRAYIACTSCMFLPNLRFLDFHFLHTFHNHVGWWFWWR